MYKLEKTEPFSGVQLEMEGRKFYWRAIDISDETFVKIEIGNYPFFKSLRMTISDMTRHYSELHMTKVTSVRQFK